MNKYIRKAVQKKVRHTFCIAEDTGHQASGLFARKKADRQSSQRGKYILLDITHCIRYDLRHQHSLHKCHPTLQ